MNASLPILLAEDNETDVFLFRRAYQAAEFTNPLAVVRDGQEAIDQLTADVSAGAALPVIIVLDQKMPRKSGADVLAWIRKSPALHLIPVFIYSTSAHPREVDNAYALGANGYLVKPASIKEQADILRFLKSWVAHIQPPTGVCDKAQRLPPADGLLIHSINP